MKKLVSILLFLSTALVAFAQNVIRVEVPNMVGLDEQFNVTFIIEGDSRPKNFEWTSGDEFQLVWGPQTGSSTSIQILNGKRTKSSQYTFTYILMPKKTGTFQLPTATATVSGKTWTSQEVSVEVVGNGASSKGSASSGSSRSEGYDTELGDVSSEDLFLRLSLSKSEAVVGEPITATLKLYQRVSVAGFEDAKFPNFTGFWSQETYTPSNIQFHRENIDDRMYNTAVLRKYVIIPQQVGRLEIDPAELVCLVNVMAPRSHSNSIFDSFFDDGYRTVRKRIRTAPMAVEVKPLPAGAPSSFGGGVGTFTIHTRVSKDSLKMHEAASLIVTLSGKGNVSLLEAPKVVLPPDFELYDTKMVDNTDKSTGGTSGTKTFEFPFIPRSYGEFEIAPVEYSYYDVEKHEYVRLATEPIAIKVEKGKTTVSASNNVSTQKFPQVERKGVKNLGEDIRYIQTKVPSLSWSGNFFVGSHVYWLSFACFLIMTVVIYLVFRKIGAMKADVAGNRNRGAVRMARKRLKLAQDYLSRNLYSAFYEELHKGISEFIADKFNLQMEELNKDNIFARLHEEGIADDLSGRLVKLLDACEYARYSPDPGHDAMSTDYEEAVEVISSIGSGMKKKRNAGAAAVLFMMFVLMPTSTIQAQIAAPDSLWNRGVFAYESGKWEEAIQSWIAIEDEGIESAEVYYNLGNAYFKSDEMGLAILNWERALRLNPSFSDARFNLECAHNMIQDRIDPVPEFILKSVARKISYWMKSNSWAVMAILFFAFVLACVLVFLLSPRRGWRIVGFYTGIVSLILSASCYGFARWQYNDYRKADSAIVMKPVSAIKSSPTAESSKDLFVLHEGTKVKILDKIGNWYNISLADGRQGWICSTDMEII